MTNISKLFDFRKPSVDVILGLKNFINENKEFVIYKPGKSFWAVDYQTIPENLRIHSMQMKKAGFTLRYVNEKYYISIS